jgi:hypothetical protein
MVLPVVGWTIGIATCFKSRHFGAAVGQSLEGVKISRDFAHTHSVRKFIASWLIMLCRCKPPLIGTQRTCGNQVGAMGVDEGRERVLMRLVGTIVGGDGLAGTGSWLLRTIGGTDPGMLDQVRCM